MTVQVRHEVLDEVELSSCEVKGLVVLLGLMYLIWVHDIVELVTDSLQCTM